MEKSGFVTPQTYRGGGISHSGWGEAIKILLEMTLSALVVTPCHRPASNHRELSQYNKRPMPCKGQLPIHKTQANIACIL